MKRLYNLYGDIILPPEELKQLQDFKNWYLNGWNYDSGSDPEDLMLEDDFINSYIIHFKEKRDRLWDAKQEAELRLKNFIQKLVDKIINKGK